MLAFVLVFDLFLVLLCTILLFRGVGLSFLHPATTYLMFHVLVVTVRLIALNSGAPTMFDDPIYRRAGYTPVTLDEIIRAAQLADLALLISTFGFVVAFSAHRKRARRFEFKRAERKAKLIDPRLYLPVMWITFFIGIVGFMVSGLVPGVEGRLIDSIALGEWESSSWVSITQTWIGVALIGFIYIYGFRRILVILTICYLSLQFYQGYHRFRFLLPVILLINIYILQHGLQWPRRWMIILGSLLIMLFFPAKYIGQLMQDGASIQEISEATVDYLSNLPMRSTSDLVFLDQFAIGLSLMDRAGHYYYGTGYLPIITLPIPRPFWPDKPGIAFYMDEIQTVDRPIGKLGMIITYLGESYVNFGIVGIILVPFLLAYYLGRFYYFAQEQPYNSIALLIYLILVSSLIQVYRDGLPSIVLFTVVNYMPIFLVIIIQVLFTGRAAGTERRQAIAIIDPLKINNRQLENRADSSPIASSRIYSPSNVNEPAQNKPVTKNHVGDTSSVRPRSPENSHASNSPEDM